MYEVEVKVRADHEAVRSHLLDAGAERIGSLRQVDTYYDAPDRNFVETDEAVRVREETLIEDGDASGATTFEESLPADSRTIFTYKGPKVEAASKTRLEAETVVEDAAGLAAILEGMGYEAAATVEKRRELYGLDGFLVSLDAVEPIGEFVEVEREIEADTGADLESAVASTRERAENLLRELELDPAAGIRRSYLALVLEAEG